MDKAADTAAVGAVAGKAADTVAAAVAVAAAATVAVAAAAAAVAAVTRQIRGQNHVASKQPQDCVKLETDVNHNWKLFRLLLGVPHRWHYTDNQVSAATA